MPNLHPYYKKTRPSTRSWKQQLKAVLLRTKIARGMSGVMPSSNSSDMLGLPSLKAIPMTQGEEHGSGTC